MDEFNGNPTSEVIRHCIIDCKLHTPPTALLAIVQESWGEGGQLMVQSNMLMNLESVVVINVMVSVSICGNMDTYCIVHLYTEFG